MRTSRIVLLLSFFVLMQPACKEAPKESTPEQPAQVEKDQYTEEYRPQFHFSPSEKWMNDPNGLVYYNGIYHLFYQYYPEDIIWGPMHWGHAVSKDLVYWEHKPIALYPDEHGYIFSGSAVVDANNTSGLGTEDKPPLVAIFTYHDMKGENAGRTDFQTQGIAYSIDNGESWEKYSGNPVIPNSGIRDFRDPKVFWHEESQKWILTLVAGDHAQFYSSADLKQWDYMSEFGRNAGAHGGVWECPDLFPLKVDNSGQDKWVLIVSINPGAPNGGSGTQYFIGDFNGTTFTSDHDDIRWLDWGTDNYAGITYNDVPGGDRIFIGWMSNWLYARDTPTEKWRSAMTVPRKLTLRNAGGKMILFNYPVGIMGTILKSEIEKDFSLPAERTETVSFDHIKQSEIRFKTTARDFVLTLKNVVDEELVLMMNGGQGKFLLDRTASGKTDFHENFGDRIQQMPIADLPEESFEVRLLLDWSSIEIFINEGQYVMTAQLFPNEPYTELQIENLADAEIEFNGFEVNKAESIW
ncbi:MAG TPA: glycoside hydrolase family 32 protein [Eudoraea sp.]|nr:glycoside hydrolase family 32 protein [Eudoraea sp.]